MSVTTTCRAPVKRAIAVAMMPMGPAPVMSTSSPTMLKARAVCVALPNGSRIEAMSSGIESGSLKVLSAGIARYCANAPGRLTPTPTVLRHRWRRPARQLRQYPQVMWPSPETRSPILNPRTSCPISTISPTYSCPTCIGTGIVFCAQSSQFQMCRSVPQIAVLRMRIMTSLCPISGFLRRVSVRPGARSSFASAFIARILNDAERFADLREGCHRAVDLLGRVRGAHLRADARLALWHHRVGEADHVHAFREQRIGHPRGERRVAEHDGDDRMLARHQGEAERGHRVAEALTVLAHAPAQRLAFGARQQLEHLE